jgi:electron transfer flavoprotein alpha subunit
VAAVWVYAELGAQGEVDRSALELVTKARALAGDVTAVALGPGALAAAGVLGEHGATRVLAGEDAVFDEYPTEPAAHVLAELVREHAPELILFGPSYGSRDVAGRLQAMLGTTLVANVDDIVALDHVRLTVALSLWPGRPGNLRGGIGGAKVVDVRLAGPTPRLAIARARAFDAEPSGGRADVVAVDVAVPESRKRARRLQRIEEGGAGVRLEEARVVIGGGRGLQGPANFALLEALAAAIGNAAVGATRPVVDAGWAPFSMQLGQTGKTVKPAVYIAVGVSGAPQHVVGISGAGYVVAINKDPNAPIFQLADLGIVGDALAVVPAVIEELQRSTSNAV